MRNAGHPFSSLYILAALILISIVLSVVLDTGEVEKLSRENNLIENFTVILYLGVIACFLFVLQENNDFRYHSAFLISLLILRELDIHREFFSDNILHFGYYLQSSVQPLEKLVAGTVILVCSYFLVRYTIYVEVLISGVRNRLGYAFTVVVALLVLSIAKLIDAIPGILHKNFAISLSYEKEMLMRIFEEMLELGFPIFILWACLQYGISKRTRRN